MHRVSLECQQGSELWAHARRKSCVQMGPSARCPVFDEDGLAQGWCQYGISGGTPGIKHHREYAKEPPPRAGWRITCVYVDKRHRGQRSRAGRVEGALDQIAVAGGGLVEAISEVTAGREAQGRFLFSATVELFE